MAAGEDRLGRIESKLDKLIDSHSEIRSALATETTRLAAHLVECETRNCIIHKRIDGLAGEQRWWNRKLFGSALGGGVFVEFIRWISELRGSQ